MERSYHSPEKKCLPYKGVYVFPVPTDPDELSNCYPVNVDDRIP